MSGLRGLSSQTHTSTHQRFELNMQPVEASVVPLLLLHCYCPAKGVQIQYDPECLSEVQ